MGDVGVNAAVAGEVETGTQLGAFPYALTVFLSACLVFLVQPMFAKMATPLLGGAPAVWNVSLVCFQAALLGGYAYAHALARLNSVKVQVAIHGALLLMAALALPLSISDMFGQPDPSHPVLWLAGTFMVSIAPPFAVISATAPLIQNWYAQSGRPDADDPYHLYASSNAGSLLGLAAYPVLMEPLATLTQQSHFWAGGYGLLSLLLIGCGVLAMRGQVRPAFATQKRSADQTQASSTTSRWRERLVWVSLAFVPSSLLIGVTTHISTDVAAAPFLWAPPLMAYIATFIIVFSRTPLISTDTSNYYLPHAILLAAILIIMPKIVALPLAIVICVHLAALFLAALALHGALSDRRPDTSRLTEFYLLMSLGGVLGSAFNALLAPIIFDGVIEYPLMLGVALLLRQATLTPRADAAAHQIPLYLIAGAALVVGVFFTLAMNVQHLVFTLTIAIVFVIAVLNATSRLVPALALCSILFIGWVADPMKGFESDRSFFGVVRTIDIPDLDVRLMMHGTTLHGAQLTNESGRPKPLNYYHIDTPIGQAFQAYGHTAKTIGVVGLGAGSVACHAQPGQTYTYYEIDPLVAKVAKDSSRFNFLSACTPNAPIILGDARIELANAPVAAYDLLLLDAFSSDSVPAHLMTREAMALYLSRLSDDGILVFHISNRHLALMPTLARIGAAEGAEMMYQIFRTDAPGGWNSAVNSDVVVLAKSKAALEHLQHDDRWQILTADDGRAWSDNYSNIIGAMIEKHRSK